MCLSRGVLPLSRPIEAYVGCFDSLSFSIPKQNLALLLQLVLPEGVSILGFGRAPVTLLTSDVRWADVEGSSTMTAQIPESVILDDRRHDLCGTRDGVLLFDPRDHGVTPIALTSECRRGYMSTYLIDDEFLYLDEIEIGIDPREPTGRDHQLLSDLFGDREPAGDPTPGHYVRLGYSITFTGGMLVGREPISEFYGHMGFHPAIWYRDVMDLQLKGGRVIARVDRSHELDEIRKKMARDDWDGTEALPEWIESRSDIEFC